jgi:hypothetical protein
MDKIGEQDEAIIRNCGLRTGFDPLKNDVVHLQAVPVADPVMISELFGARVIAVI